MFDNRHKYILNSPIGRLVLEQDPMGWDETETDIRRSEKTHGIFLTISNNLRFAGQSKDYLETAYQAYGVNAQVKLEKFIKHPKTDDWLLAFSGYLDFTSRNIKKGALEVNFVEGGLREALTTNIREDFELGRKTDVRGNIISDFRPDRLTLEGRDIFLLSRLENDVEEFEIKSGRYASSDGIRESFLPLPMTVAANTDPENIKEPVPFLNTYGGYGFLPESGAFFLIANRDRGKTELQIKSTFTLDDIHVDDFNNFEHIDVKLYRFSGGDAFVVEQETMLLEIDNPFAVLGQVFSIDQRFVFEGENRIKEGDSFVIYVRLQGAYGNTQTGDRGHMNVKFNNYTGSISWSEDSFFGRTEAKCLTFHDIGERPSEIYSGTPCFESSVLTEGKWKELVATCGGWVRNLQKEVETKDNQGVVIETKRVEWPMVFSWDKFYETLNAIEPVAYGIASEGTKQRIVLENIDYFFQRVVTVDLGDLDVEERSTAAEYIYSSITTGYQEGGNYERPLGLDEYNTRTNWITPVRTQNLKLEALSPSRADPYGLEDARRKQYTTHPEEDTPYDDHNFVIDGKMVLRNRGRGGSFYSVRKWQDDFETAPTGVYSPETAYNLRLTPAHNLLRHSKWFNGGLMPMQEDYLRFASSEGNSELTTQLKGEEPLKENADIQISKTKRAMFEPEWIKGKRSFSQEILQKIQGQSKINGRTVNNYYGMFKYRASDTGEIERAFLFTVKVKNEFDFKLLKVYGF